MAMLGLDAQADAQAELGVVLEQAVRPRRATTFAVARVGRGRQVAAVDAAATGGVGDDHVVAEKLGEQLDVGRLTAPSASAAELEQWLAQLAGLHARRVPQARVGRRHPQEALSLLHISEPTRPY